LDTTNTLGNAIMEYLVAALARPTHSPEEAYYNMLRIETTGQAIYKEDHLLDRVLGPPGSDASLKGNLDGWGWNGSTMVNYQQAGWQSGLVDAGQVWWMLYAGRWLKNTDDAASSLTTCLNQFWLKGTPGGLASEYCNAANAGLLKNKVRLQLDVAYAIYLLTGKSPADFPPQIVVPRWTLDDAG
jgi:hypothetical protein